MKKVSQDELKYLLNCVDFGKSFLDAKAIDIMNRLNTIFFIATEEELMAMMKKSIIESKDKGYSEAHPTYWLSQLDYTSEVSHPAYRVLESIIEKEIKVLQEAEDIKAKYRSIGLEI